MVHLPETVADGKRLRIALVGPVYPFRGGISHYTALMAQRLGQRGHEVLVVTFNRGYPRLLFPGRTDRDPSDAPIRVASEPMIAPLDPISWWRAGVRISKWMPDLTVVQWWVPFWAPSLGAVARIIRRHVPAPVIFVCHNVLPHGGATWLERQLTRYALNGANGYIVHSGPDAVALAQLIPETVDREGAAPASRRVRQTMLAAHELAPPLPLAAARRRLAIPPEAKIALFFGLVRPYKGLRYLLGALPEVLRSQPEFRLLVAGEFWEPRAEYQDLAARLGVSDYVTWVDRYLPNEEVAVFFSAADVVVQPYLEATQSGVVATAVTFGRPSIVTRVGGLPEAVEDGVSGLVVQPADEAALAGALVRFFEEPGLRERLTYGAQQAAKTRFGWTPVISTLEEFAYAAPF